MFKKVLKNKCPHGLEKKLNPIYWRDAKRGFELWIQVAQYTMHKSWQIPQLSSYPGKGYKYCGEGKLVVWGQPIAI